MRGLSGLRVLLLLTILSAISLTACGSPVPSIDPAPDLLTAFAGLPSDFLSPWGIPGERREAAKTAQDGVVARFAVVSDLHVLSPQLHDDEPAFRRWLNTNDGKILARSAELVDATIASLQQMNEQEPLDFVVFPGDLTANGAVQSHQYLADAFGELTTVGIGVYVIPGNHDINNPWAASFRGRRVRQEPTVQRQDFERIWAAGGYNTAVSRAPDDTSYRADPTPDLTLMLIDTARYEQNDELGRPETPGVLRPSTYEWLVRETTAARSEGREVLFVHHHSLADHSGIGRYATLRYRLPEWQSLVDLGAIFFTGHVHVVNNTRIDAPDGSAVYDISSGSASVFPHTFRVVTITESGGMRVETRLLAGLDTAETRQWSLATYFDDHVVRFGGRLERDLGANGSEINDEDRRAMALVIGALSIQHRAGHDSSEVHPEFIARLPSLDRGATLWQTLAPERYAFYQRAFGSDPPPADGALTIPLW